MKDKRYFNENPEAVFACPETGNDYTCAEWIEIENDSAAWVDIEDYEKLIELPYRVRHTSLRECQYFEEWEDAEAERKRIIAEESRTPLKRKFVNLPDGHFLTEDVVAEEYDPVRKIWS